MKIFGGKTLEMIIEELTSALSLERWKAENARAEISRLKKEIEELKEKNNG